MTVAEAIAHILKAEGVEILFAYPVNPIIETAAAVGIRPIIVRQERIGLHMADAVSRLSSGEKIGVFCMQSGPGAENAFGGVAQAYGESSPILVMPMGYARSLTHVDPNFNSVLNFRHVTKSCEQIVQAGDVQDILRRAFTQVRNGRPRPALVEIPSDVFTEELPSPLDYRPVPRTRSGPDPSDLSTAVTALLDAKRPVIYAGQGVHYAKAWDPLKEFAELLEAPVMTSLGGKSAFPESQPLALGAGGVAIPGTVHHFLNEADLIFGIGCSFTKIVFGANIPPGKTIVHATLDPGDINKDVEVTHALVGDAALTLHAMNAEIAERQRGRARGRLQPVTAEIKKVKGDWLAGWSHKVNSDEVPMTPYRVIRDLMQTVDVPNTIVTHDAGSPRDQLTPFWESVTPLSYIGWGKTTQLGYGLGLAMGRSSRIRTSSALTSGETQPSDSQAWTSKPPSASASPSSPSSSTTSAWPLSSKSCPFPRKSIRARTSRGTMRIWRRRLAGMGNG